MKKIVVKRKIYRLSYHLKYLNSFSQCQMECIRISQETTPVGLSYERKIKTIHLIQNDTPKKNGDLKSVELNTINKDGISHETSTEINLVAHSSTPLRGQYHPLQNDTITTSQPETFER